jgi:hypothetical protein
MTIHVHQLKTVYVDIPTLQETFADFVRLLVVKDNVMRIELCTTRFDDPHPAQTGKLYPVVRLALPISAAMQLRDYLTQHLAELAKEGILKCTDASTPIDPKH